MTTYLPPFYGHYAGQPALAGTPVKNWSILSEKFYCPHALADDNWHIWIMEKMLVLLNGITY